MNYHRHGAYFDRRRWDVCVGYVASAVERGAPARFGFTGELQQGSSVHLRARWYNAASGSFASVDPYAGDPANPAPYMYASNQPTLFTDPSGRCIFFAGVDAVGCILIGAAIAGGALAVGLSVNQAVSQCGYAHCFDGLWPDAATIENNSAQIARGWDFVSRGGQGMCGQTTISSHNKRRPG
ncbi:hypothetical protein F8S13_12700 [Chloroflexia bacterium SDU3-3]|nr:hypothetical protein F8S13_12700 [Chloroflexia bacterium SDU3-3]